MTAPFEVFGSDAPAPFHLTDGQLDQLRDALLTTLDQQRRSLPEHADALLGATDDVPDAEVTTARELADAVVRKANGAVAVLEEALDRLDAGAYGLCQSCGLPIPWERLEAVPETAFCIGCPRPRGLFG